MGEPKLAKHWSWTGSKHWYQRRAQHAWLFDNPGHPFRPWAWVVTSCGTEMCMNVDCMKVLSPIRIAYPAGVCVYCGDVAGTMDHLLPQPFTGSAIRRSVAVVPACASCNSALGATFAPTVPERRKIAQDRLRRRKRKLLESPVISSKDLDQMGHSLRQAAIKRNAERDRVRAQLTWPDDQMYDRRAFEKSGIDDPETLGLA